MHVYKYIYKYLNDSVIVYRHEKHKYTYVCMYIIMFVFNFK